MDELSDIGITVDGGPHLGKDSAHISAHGHADVISETQLNGYHSNRDNKYNEISASIGLIALGKHVLTPRQGQIWEYMNKFPLGKCNH